MVRVKCNHQKSILNNFFSAIGIADMEKVHSAVIGWMLSDKCKINIKLRSNLLQQIFGVKDNYDCFDNIEVFLEWKHIDILIVTKKDNVQKCWIIENKIKSSQHSDQLNRYVDNILTKTNNPFVDLNKKYCFLTLIDELPKCNRKGINWVNTKYSDLRCYLREALDKCSKNDKKNILEEYYNCIDNLCSALEDFLERHQNYKNVFSDGGKTKEEKLISRESLLSSKYALFINENGLETIFQKCFLLSKIIPNTKFKIFNYGVAETHGKAFVDFKYKIVNNVSFAFQFQNGSFKVQIHDKNKNGNPVIFSRNWEEKLQKIRKSHSKWRINKSKGKKISYISISKIFFNKIGPWFQSDIQTIIDTWNKAYDECIDMMNNLLKII